ncbi:MAG: mechanosensitive ion channel family protein [Hyphomicrobiaceae bacterium]
MTVPAPLLEQLENYRVGFWEALPQLAAAMFLLIVTWGVVYITRYIIDRFLRAARARRSLIELFQMLASVGLWIFGILIATTVALPSVTPGKVLTALGLGSVAIGFAFKDVFENFLAGIFLLVREPFRLGDFIEVEGVEGQVGKITVRDTHIRQTNGELVVMPNALIFKNPVHVLTEGEMRRTTIVCGVSYDTDVDDAREVITKAVRNVDTVRDDVKDVQIFAQAFGSSSIDFEITWWTGSRPVDIRRSRDEVVRAVKRALDDAGIEIPFPYRTLTFKTPLDLRSNMGEDRDGVEEKHIDSDATS